MGPSPLGLLNHIQGPLGLNRKYYNLPTFRIRRPRRTGTGQEQTSSPVSPLVSVCLGCTSMAQTVTTTLTGVAF